MSIKVIVVATDFSEHSQRAFEYSCVLAAELGASIRLLHVQEESSLRIAVKEGLLRDDSTDDHVKDEVKLLLENRMAAVMAGADLSRIKVTTDIRRGDPKVLTVAYATETNADLIAVGSRGAGFIDEFRNVVLGSVAETLIRTSPCPVIVVRTDHRTQD